MKETDIHPQCEAMFHAQIKHNDATLDFQCGRKAHPNDTLHRFMIEWHADLTKQAEGDTE